MGGSGGAYDTIGGGRPTPPGVLENGLRTSDMVMALQNYSQSVPWQGPITNITYSSPFGTFEYLHRDDHAHIQAQEGPQVLPIG